MVKEGPEQVADLSVTLMKTVKILPVQVNELTEEMEHYGV